MPFHSVAPKNSVLLILEMQKNTSKKRLFYEQVKNYCFCLFVNKLLGLLMIIWLVKFSFFKLRTRELSVF